MKFLHFFQFFCPSRSGSAHPSANPGPDPADQNQCGSGSATQVLDIYIFWSRIRNQSQVFDDQKQTLFSWKKDTFQKFETFFFSILVGHFAFKIRIPEKWLRTYLINFTLTLLGLQQYRRVPNSAAPPPAPPPRKSPHMRTSDQNLFSYCVSKK